MPSDAGGGACGAVGLRHPVHDGIDAFGDAQCVGHSREVRLHVRLAPGLALQRAQELRFSEAALLLGLVNQADLDAARGHMASPSAAARGALSATLAGYADRSQPLSQKVGALRAQLLLRVPAGQGLRLAVVSPAQGDGRSELAAALAMACAQSGQATLLIDADLRRPSQHQLFSLDGSVGLRQALGGDALPRPREIDGVPMLAVLPAGGPAADALELVSSKPFRGLIESFAQHYRHIIVDTPAAATGYDGTAVAMACGAALLVARRNHTPMPASQQLVSQLRAVPTPLLGSVLF